MERCVKTALVNGHATTAVHRASRNARPPDYRPANEAATNVVRGAPAGAQALSSSRWCDELEQCVDHCAERVAAPGNPPIPPVTLSEGVCDGLTHNHAQPVRPVPVVGAVRPARTAASKVTPSASTRGVFRCVGDRRMDASTMAPHNCAKAARCVAFKPTAVKTHVRIRPNASWSESDAFKVAFKSAYPTSSTDVQHGGLSHGAAPIRCATVNCCDVSIPATTNAKSAPEDAPAMVSRPVSMITDARFGALNRHVRLANNAKALDNVPQPAKRTPWKQGNADNAVLMSVSA